MLIPGQLPVVLELWQQLQRESLQSWQKWQSWQADFFEEVVSTCEHAGADWVL